MADDSRREGSCGIPLSEVEMLGVAVWPSRLGSQCNSNKAQEQVPNLSAKDGSMKKKASKKKVPAVGWVYNNGKDMTLSQMAEQYAGHLLEVWRANWHGRAADCDDSINEVADMAYKMAKRMMEKRNET